MLESLIDTLTTFGDDQWKRLQKYLQSQHSENSDLLRIFVFYRKNRSQLETMKEVKTTRIVHFSRIKHKRFLNLHSELNAHIEDFLIFNYIHEDANRKDLILNKIYNDIGLFERADQKARRLQRSISSDNSISLENIINSATLYHQQYYSDNPVKYKEGDHYLRKLVRQQLITSKIRFLLYKCELISWGTIRQYDYEKEIQIISELVELIEDTELSKILRILEDLIVKPNLMSFLELRGILYDGKIASPSVFHTILTMYLLNALLKLWHLNLYSDTEEAVKLYEYALNSGVLMYNGKIPVVRFHNIISTLGAFKSKEWTSKFIERWKDKIAGFKVDSTVRLAKAQNALKHGEYRSIRPLLTGLEYDLGRQKIRALSMELIVLYLERKHDYALLRNFIVNFKRTLKRLKPSVSDYFYNGNLNFIKVIELMVKRDFTRVTIHPEKYKPLVYRKWISEEISKVP